MFVFIITGSKWTSTVTKPNLGSFREYLKYGFAPFEKNRIFQTDFGSVWPGLPASLTDPLLLPIGYYQVPMYLPPFLLQHLHADKP